MDILKNKTFESYNYNNRYTEVPFYFNTVDQREIYGIGTQVNKTTTYVTHKLVQEDTLDSLALKYYGNPTLWWAIAYFNDIQDAFINLAREYKTIKVPRISSIKFEEAR